MNIKKRYKTNVMLIMLVLNLLFLVQFSFSEPDFPPFPTEFYGNVTTYDSGAPAGSIVEAFDSSGLRCGFFNVKYEGYFGLLSCKGDDPYTDSIDEGPVDYEGISFTVEGYNTTVFGDARFNEESFTPLWIVYPPIVCGDGKCHKEFEDCGKVMYCNDIGDGCRLCEEDINQSLINETNQTTGTGETNDTTTTGGGGAAGGGGGDSGGGGAAGGGGATGGVVDTADMEFACVEDWTCLDWSVCHINNTQDRICYDTNSCNTTEDKPETLQECIYEGTCFDGIQNGLEEGIDCGGLCTPCPWEEEPTCFDGKQNCPGGICEEGIDCGGPCEEECEIKKPLVELPLEICKRGFKYYDLTYWIFLIIVTLAIWSDYKNTKRKVRKYRNNEDLDDYIRAKKIVHTKRNLYVFIITLSVIALLLLGYYYYFSQCQSYLTDFLWILIILLIATPIIGFIILKSFEYDEKNRIIKMSRYFESHHSRLHKVIEMHNKYLIEIENEISNQIYQLLHDDELKNELDAFPQLSDAYRQMMKLYDEYKVNAKPYSIEKNLVEDMYNLINDIHFKELTDKYPRIKSLYDDIVLLFKQYEEKQKIYDEEKKERDNDEENSKENNEENKDIKNQETNKSKGDTNTNEKIEDGKDKEENAIPQNATSDQNIPNTQNPPHKVIKV